MGTRRYVLLLALGGALGCAPATVPEAPALPSYPERNGARAGASVVGEDPAPPLEPLPEPEDCRGWLQLARAQAEKALAAREATRRDRYARTAAAYRTALGACSNTRNHTPVAIAELYFELGRALAGAGARDEALAVFEHLVEHGERPVVEKSQAQISAITKTLLDLERAQTDPKSAIALHFEVIRFWFLAGDVEHALKDVDYWEGRWGKNASALELAVIVAEHHVRRGEWKDALERISNTAAFQKTAWLHTRVGAHALRGRAFARMKRDVQARREYDAARTLWKDPKKATEQLFGEAANADNAKRRMQRALDAVGEAVFYFADRERAKLRVLTLPSYRGPADAEKLSRFIEERWAVWAKARKRRIEAATGEYLLIVGLEPVAPPRWVVRAAASTGEMWAGLLASLEATPTPKSIQSHPELVELFRSRVSEVVEMDARYAVTAYETCLEYSVAFTAPLGPGEDCRDWLVARRKKESSAK